jgi:hypothetical protein
MAEGADTGSDTASQGAIGSESLLRGGQVMLDKQNRTRAITFYDGGRIGGDAHRAQISICSRFVLLGQARVRIEIARMFAILFVAGMTVTGSANFSLAFDPCLVSTSSEAGATRMAEGADTGSDTASQGAIGSESLFQNSPGEPHPVSRGELE